MKISERFLNTKAAVFALVAGVFGAVAAMSTPVISSDTHFYMSLARAIVEGKSDVFLTSRSATWTVLTFPALLALAQRIAPTHWAAVMVALNVVVGALTAVLLLWVVTFVTRSQLALGVALLFYVSAYDILAWLKFVLTDMVYSCIALAAFGVALQGIMREKSTMRRRILLGVLLLASFITRPAGAILVPLVLLTEWMAVKRRAPWLLLMVLALVVFFIRAYVYDDMRRWPFDFMKPKLEEYALRESTGEVVWGRQESFRPPPSSVLDRLTIQTDRFVRFFQITTSGFSRAHNLINLGYYVPLYLLALLGVIGGFRSSDWRVCVAVQATVIWILGSAWFHAITILDFDWRYRLPVMPQLILLAAAGVDAIVRRFAPQPWPER
ncbi:MAG: hypothetical protein ABI779_21745 [Acidobacteriota bacterium]